MITKNKMAVARLVLSDLSKSATNKYGDNNHAYIAGYLESAMVYLLADLSDEAYDDQIAMIVSATDKLKALDTAE